MSKKVIKSKTKQQPIEEVSPAIQRIREFRDKSQKPLEKLNPDVADKILAWYRGQTEEAKLAVLLAGVMSEDFEGRDLFNEILNTCRETGYKKIQQTQFQGDGTDFVWGIFAGIRGRND